MGALGAAAAPMAFAREARAPKRPNILFLLIDDQRNDQLGCAGHPILKTPAIDAICTT